MSKPGFFQTNGTTLLQAQKKAPLKAPFFTKYGRGRGIRTPDILLPKQARYRTALYPRNAHRKTDAH